MPATSYNQAQARAVLNYLGISQAEFNDEDIFVILPGQQSSIYRIPRLNPWRTERIQSMKASGLSDGSQVIDAATCQQIIKTIPFYNQDKSVTGYDGTGTFKVDSSPLTVQAANGQTEQLSRYQVIMWQPNLSGQLLSKFIKANIDNAFPSEPQPGTGYWIDLRNFRSTLKDIESPTINDGTRDYDQNIPLSAMPDYPLPLYRIDGQVVERNLYVVAWDDPVTHRAGEYSVYFLGESYYTQMPEIELTTGSEHALRVFFVDSGCQTAALSKWEAYAMHLAQHGLCYVANLTSFNNT